jgi:hypothetical protein
VLTSLLLAGFVQLQGWSCSASDAQDNDHPATLRCSGPVEKKILIRMAGNPVTLGVSSVLGAETIVAVGRYYSGDDEFYETAVLAIVDGELRDVRPDHWITTYRDVLCFGHLPNGAVGVMNLAYDWDMDREAHAHPHRYKLTPYEWTGDSFRVLPLRWTTGQFNGWRPAAAELGLQCEAPYGGLHGWAWPEDSLATGATAK